MTRRKHTRTIRPETDDQLAARLEAQGERVLREDLPYNGYQVQVPDPSIVRAVALLRCTLASIGDTLTVADALPVLRSLVRELAIHVGQHDPFPPVEVVNDGD